MAGVIIPKLYGLITIDTTRNNLSVQEVGQGGATALALTQADYYIRKYTGEATDQLVEQVQEAIRSAAGMGTATVTVSDAGFVTIVNATNFTLTWTDVGLRDVLGFTATLTGAATYTAANQHRYGWYPNTGVASMAVHPNSQGFETTDATVRRAPSGRIVTFSYDTFTDNEFEFRWIEDEYAFPVGLGGTTVVNRDFRTFWYDNIRVGRPFRFYPDRTVQTAPDGTAPWLFKGGEDITRKGTTLLKAEVSSFSKYWRFDLDVMKYET